MSKLMSPMMIAKSGTEHGEQTALIQWVRWHYTICDELRFLFAIPNGGARDAITASQLKAEGVKPGVSDLMLPVPRHERHGLWIEMKKFKGGTESDEQVQWGEDMRRMGYGYVCCHGWQAAAEVLMGYLGFSERPWGDGSMQSQCQR